MNANEFPPHPSDSLDLVAWGSYFFRAIPYLLERKTFEIHLLQTLSFKRNEKLILYEKYKTLFAFNYNQHLLT